MSASGSDLDTSVQRQSFRSCRSTTRGRTPILRRRRSSCCSCWRGATGSNTTSARRRARTSLDVQCPSQSPSSLPSSSSFSRTSCSRISSRCSSQRSRSRWVGSATRGGGSWRRWGRPRAWWVLRPWTESGRVICSWRRGCGRWRTSRVFGGGRRSCWRSRCWSRARGSPWAALAFEPPSF